MGGVAEYPVFKNTTLVIRDADISGYSAQAWKLSGGVLGGRGLAAYSSAAWPAQAAGVMRAGGTSLVTRAGYLV